MNIQEALKTRKYVRRRNKDFAFCWHEPKTGPYRGLVSCDYFSFYEDGFLTFSTSAPDFYAEDLLAEDFEIFEVTELEIELAKQRTDGL